MAYRIGRWFMSIIKHCERKHPKDIKSMQAEFLRLWKHTIPHYLTIDCNSDCPCHLGIGDAQLPDDNDCGFFAAMKNKEGASSTRWKFILAC